MSQSIRKYEWDGAANPKRVLIIIHENVKGLNGLQKKNLGKISPEKTYNRKNEENGKP